MIPTMTLAQAFGLLGLMTGSVIIGYFIQQIELKAKRQVSQVRQPKSSLPANDKEILNALMNGSFELPDISNSVSDDLETIPDGLLEEINL